MSKLTDLWIKVTKEKEIEEYSKDVQELYDYTIQLQQERDKYKSIVDELKEFVENEIIECKATINTILPEFEKIMPRGCGKTLLTNEYNKFQTIIKSFKIVLSKIKELEEGNSNDSK